MSAGPLIYFVAGEPSGDLLAGRLMSALEEEADGNVRFAGVGGESMAERGFSSLFDIRDLAVMGLWEVVPHIPLVLRRLREVDADIEACAPDAVITVDSWGFTGRVHKRLHGKGSRIPRLHYVAPQVWAWRAGRARKIAGVLDHLLTLLPNEPPYFEAHGLSATCVGHPVVESGADKGDSARFRKKNGVGEDVPVLSVLPGSRRTEVERLLPVFREAVVRIAQIRPRIQVAMPTVPTVAEEVKHRTQDWPVNVHIVRGEAARYDAFAASRAALAASGTVALELAMAGVPHVVAYRVSPLTGFLARRLIRVPYVNLTNLVLNEPVIPERLQEECTPDILCEDVIRLMESDPVRKKQEEGVTRAMEKLGGRGNPPSRKAARVVLNALSG